MVGDLLSDGPYFVFRTAIVVEEALDFCRCADVVDVISIIQLFIAQSLNTRLQQLNAVWIVAMIKSCICTERRTMTKNCPVFQIQSLKETETSLDSRGIEVAIVDAFTLGATQQTKHKCMKTNTKPTFLTPPPS